MPFKSEAQRRYLWANEPEIARDWADTYGSRIQAANGGGMGWADQGGMKNYLGEQPMVNAPQNWRAGPNTPPAELAYVTGPEKDLILQANMHGSLANGPNEGPSGIMSLDTQGDYTPDRSPKGTAPGVGGGHSNYMNQQIQQTHDQKMKDFYTGNLSQKDPMMHETTGSGQSNNFNPIDAYMKYGIIPNVFRGVKNIFTPKTDAQKVQANIKKGYDVHNPAEMHGLGTRRPPVLATSGGGDGQQQYYPPWFDDTSTENILDDEELDIDTSTGDMDEWIQRFRVKDPYRQDEGALDEQIKEYVSKLYTTP